MQEVYAQAPEKITNEERYLSLDIFSVIKEELPEHNAYFRPVVKGIYGIAMFVKNNIQLIDEGQPVMVVNTHGLWNGIEKRDTPDRINQPLKIKEF